MKSKVIHITLAFALILALCISVSAEGNDLSVHEITFLELINEARANPLEIARSIGISPDRILQDFPELEGILTEGLPPLTFNISLYEAAGGHSADMIENSYYSHDSLDGRTCYDRITATGYLPVVTGESLGLLGFSNFIDPEESVRAMFENLLRDELDPSNREKRNILNPEFTHVGIALGTGTMNIGGYIFNVYVVTCDFGRSVETVSMEIVHLINQARCRPLDVIASLGMDPARVLADHQELADILTEGLPPLTVDLRLYAAAAAHAGDMLEAGYFSHDSSDGRTFYDRIVEAGYDPEVAGESLGMCYYQPDEELPLDRAQGVLYDMFRSELEEGADRAILNPDLRDVGVGLIVGQSESFATICSDHVLFVVADFGTPAGDDPSPRIVGVVYEDRDGDLMYDQSEGLGSIPVVIEGDAFSGVVYTSEAGGFSKVLHPGAYRISCEWGDTQVIEEVEIAENHVSVFLRIPPADDDGGEEDAVE